MKRFWNAVTVAPEEGGFRVALDGRPLRTQGGAAQIVPTRALAEALAGEWRVAGAAAGDRIDRRAFPLRDLADLAIDRIAADRGAQVTALLRYGETDTLCYFADPQEPLFARQQAVWEPLLAAAEARYAIRLERISGVVHRPQPPATLARLRSVLEAQDAFGLAALATMVPLAASLVVGLAALEEGADPARLFAAAACEEDWQAELWGSDEEAARIRAAREAVFVLAARFARLADASADWPGDDGSQPIQSATSRAI